ncbi:hypothetical protein V8F06_013935, partial [Rhypophila decipiens]
MLRSKQTFLIRQFFFFSFLFFSFLMGVPPNPRILGGCSPQFPAIEITIEIQHDFATPLSRELQTCHRLPHLHTAYFIHSPPSRPIKL